MSEIGDFANATWENLGSPATPTVSYISGWAENNLGIFNVALNTCFTVSGSDFSPHFGNAESGIYQELFNIKYYELRSRDAIHNTLDGTGTLFWTNIKEGDSSISRSNPNEVMKTYLSLKKDSKEEYNRLVAAYKRNLFAPHQVVKVDP